MSNRIMRIFRGMIAGWFAMDAIYLMIHHPLGYPAWVPIVGLLVVGVSLEWKLIKHEVDKGE